MRNSKLMVGMILTAALVAFTPSSRAEDTNSVAASVKPDLLTTCPVSGDKLGGDMGKPYVMVYQGQEVKFCCPMCKKDFDKDPAKYIALIRAADKAKAKP